MPQRSSSPVILTLVLLLAAVVPQQASAPQQPPPPPAGAPASRGPPRPQPVQTVTVTHVPLELFNVPDGLEVTLWAETPMLRNPTNMDIDRDGRIWVAEGVRYRSHHARQPEGDRIVVLEDSDKDGKADKHVDVRPGGRPGGAARRRRHRQQGRGVTAARPDRLHGRRSQPALRSGRRQARGAADRIPGQEPRSLAALGHGRPGRQVDVQLRQHRRDVHRQVGQDVPRVRRLSRRPGRSVQEPARPGGVGRQAERRRPHLRRRLHGADEPGRHQRRDHRPQLPQQLRAVDQLVRRRLPERQRRPAGLPRQLRDGVRELRLLVERRAAQLAGGSPAGAVDAGGGVAAGRPGHDAVRRRLRRRLADRQRVLRERRAGRGLGGHVPRGRSRPQRGVLVPAEAVGRELRAATARSSSPRTRNRNTPGPISSAAAAA